MKGQLSASSHRPRSLTSLLGDHSRAQSDSLSRREGELEGESELIPLSEDFAPLFRVPPLPSPANIVENRASKRKMLTDLLPAGFTKSTLSSLAAASVTAETDRGGRTFLEEDLELKGRQLWTCLVPNAAAASIRMDHDTSGVQGEQVDLHLFSDTQDNKKRGFGLPTARATKTTRNEQDEAAASTEKMGLASEHRGEGAAQTQIDVRAREDELNLALDRLVPRLLQSEKRVKFLERNLEQAKHAESGRNALVKQITKLEEEVKHLRHRQEIHHAETVEWRDKRHFLEADNQRLTAELHSALGRNTVLETDIRRREALLAEARSSVNVRAHNYSTFEAKLRHKDQLLAEAERDKKHAWQTSHAFAEAAKAATMQAEAAAKEVCNLRNVVSYPGGQNSESSNLNIGSPSEEAEVSRTRGQSLAKVVAAAAAAATAAAAGEAAEGGRHSSDPEPTSLALNSSLAGQCGGKSQASSPSPETGRSVDHAVAPSNEAIDCVRINVEQRSAKDLHEALREKRRGTPRNVSPLALLRGADRRTTQEVFQGETYSEFGWQQTSAPSSSQDNQGSPTIASEGSGRRVRENYGQPPRTAREQSREGDKQRHDSEGVKGALTGASPEWTDAPLPFGDNSPTAVTRRMGNDTCSNASGVNFTERSCSAVDAEAKGYRISENANSENPECRHHTEVRDDCDVCLSGDVRPGIEERSRQSEGDFTAATDALASMARETAPNNAPARFAAGHKGGRDWMSSPRSSLSGAGGGVAVVAGQATGMMPIRPDRTKEAMHESLDVGGGSSTHHGATNDTFKGRYMSAGGTQDFNWPRKSKPERRHSTGVSPPATSSVASTPLAMSLTSLVEDGDCPRAPDFGAKARRERRASAPYATDAAEDELRPIREVERRLMLLLMETSQLEAEQSKLIPKASKTMQARIQLQKIEGRLELLAHESSGLRRVLREKSWKM